MPIRSKRERTVRPKRQLIMKRIGGLLTTNHQGMILLRRLLSQTTQSTKATTLHRTMLKLLPTTITKFLITKLIIKHLSIISTTSSSNRTNTTIPRLTRMETIISNILTTINLQTIKIRLSSLAISKSIHRLRQFQLAILTNPLTQAFK